MLTISSFASSFAPQDERHQRRKRPRETEEFDDGCGWTNVSGRPWRKGLVRHRPANPQAQRDPAGALCAGPRVDAADQGTSRRSVLHDVSDRARGRSGRHRFRRLDGRPAWRGADADLRVCDARQRAGLARDTLSDPADHVRVRARDARRIQLRAIAGVPHHAARARLARDGASHRNADRRVRIHRRPVDQASHHHAGAGCADPVAAFDRRQGIRQVSAPMNKPANPACNTKVMNRADLTSRLVARLKNEEAVVGGIGNTNFDLWAAGHRPQNFYMLGSMGLAFPIALGVALAQPKRRVFALEGDGSLLMQLGCLSTIAMLKPKNLTMVVMDNGIYQITGAQPTPAAATTDLMAVAIGCGLANSAWAADEEDFERLIDESLTSSEPMLIGVRIDDKPGTGATRRDPVQIRERFMNGLGVRDAI